MFSKIKEFRKVGINFFYLSILNFTNLILPILTFPYLVQKLGVEMFGLLAFATSIVTYFQVLTDYGFNLTATKQISQHRDDASKISEIVSSVYIIKIILFLISLLILIILVFTIPTLGAEKGVFLLTLGWVLGQILFPIWFFQGIEKMRIITILNVVAKVVFTLCIFYFIKEKSDYYLVPIFNALGFIIIGVVSIFVLIFKYKVRFYFPSYEVVKSYLIDGKDIFFSNISVTLYTSSVVVFLGFFSNNVLLGYYTIADKIIGVIRSVVTPLAQALYPHLIYIATVDRKKVLNLNRKLFYVGIFGMSMLCLGTFLFADKIIYLIAKDYVKEAELVLKILLPIPILIVFANVFALFTMLVFGRNKAYSNIIISAGLISIPLSLLLIPFYQHVGAAITVLLIELYITFRYVIYVQRSDLKIL